MGGWHFAVKGCEFMQNENKVLQILCQEILRCVEKKISNAGYDKTYKARILRYDNVKQAYIVSLNNSEAIVKNGSNNRYSNGSFVWVTAPCGDLNNLYISGEVKIY